MPEYLAPGVYVEEIDTGSKPIEGVSTSTAGMVGVTERGPVNVPILITSNGEYQRWFGGMLNATLYGEHRFLPHAIEGFFINGGKRVYVTRVLDPSAATTAERMLVAPDTATPLSTQLLLGADPGATSVVVVDNPGFAPSHTIQVGDGADVEFLTISNAPPPAPAPIVLPLSMPLLQGHGVGQVAQVITVAAGVPPPTKLAAPASTGNNIMTVQNTGGLSQNDILAIGAAPTLEYGVIKTTLPGNRLELKSALLFTHAINEAVTVQTATVGNARNLGTVARSGDAIVVTQTSAGTFNRGDLVGISTPSGGGDFDRTQSNAEIRSVGELTRITLEQGTYADYAIGSLVQRITLNAPIPAIDLEESSDTGATVVMVSNRTALVPGDILEIGVGTDREFSEIAALPAPLPAPNKGKVVLRAALRKPHAKAVGIVTRRQFTITNMTVMAAHSPIGNPTLVIADQAGLAASNLVRIVTPVGGPYYHALAGAPAPTALQPQTLTLATPLKLTKTASAAVVRRAPMMVVRALDAGQWGDRLRVAMELQDSALLRTRVRGNPVTNFSLKLESASGVESGTELMITDAGGNIHKAKVQSIDRQNDYLITLEPSTPLPGSIAGGDSVHTVEYRFVVELLRQRDPANPARNNMAIDREVFSNLSLDPRHSRYFERVIGTTWNSTNPSTTQDDEGQPLRKADRRSEGESSYIRVSDSSVGTGLRQGPVATYETRRDGTRRLILLPLNNGDDALGVVIDKTYVGKDEINPELRTGLFTLRNIEEISIVAVPGRTNVEMQSALINHCEFMRYRFCALDGMPPPKDSMTDVQTQRQQFDTKYAALYHPWLIIPDPYPTSPSRPADYPIPPSGHMLGIYARTDIERGVHKAPANEVVRGIIGLQRTLNKEQHDILNPYPVNINVVRDFRNNNRGIRIYGGRVITSDSDWKYVNVRRLLIFIEASIDRGLQWVVFEPNAEPLWARVRRSISNFLTLVWRNGALEGTKPEEAYFVKCDRTTMTQTDIDSGRLICVIGVAPVKPAEFVIVRIGLWTAHADD